MERRCKSDADKNLVFGGAYVSYVAFFEAQLEYLFVGLLSGSLNHPNRDVKPIVSFNTNRAAKEFVFGGRNYVDWLPFENNTLTRAKVFFKHGLPFASLDQPRKESLFRAGILRNAIAHQSDHSQHQFEKHFLSGRAIPNLQRRPSSYLRGSFSQSQNRFEVQLIELVATMNDLCS